MAGVTTARLLTAAQAQGWKSRPLGVSRSAGTGRNRYPAFVDLVRRQLRRDYREEDLRNEGLRIFTTLAPSDQHYAELAVTGGLQSLQEQGLPATLQAALVLADVASGEVRAIVGDRKPDRAGFNRALDARRQIGSVVKPLVYLMALEHDEDYNLLSRVADEPLTLRQADGSLRIGAMRLVLNVEAAAAFDDLVRSGRVDELTRQGRGAWPSSFRTARFVPAVEFIRAQRARRILMNHADLLMSRYDAFVTPNSSGSLTMTNLTGHPALAVPCGFDEDGEAFLLLPMRLSICAR